MCRSRWAAPTFAFPGGEDLRWALKPSPLTLPATTQLSTTSQHASARPRQRCTFVSAASEPVGDCSSGENLCLPPSRRTGARGRTPICRGPAWRNVPLGRGSPLLPPLYGSCACCWSHLWPQHLCWETGTTRGLQVSEWAGKRPRSAGLPRGNKSMQHERPSLAPGYHSSQGLETWGCGGS